MFELFVISFCAGCSTPDSEVLTFVYQSTMTLHRAWLVEPPSSRSVVRPKKSEHTSVMIVDTSQQDTLQKSVTEQIVPRRSSNRSCAMKCLPCCHPRKRSLLILTSYGIGNFDDLETAGLALKCQHAAQTWTSLVMSVKGASIVAVVQQVARTGENNFSSWCKSNGVNGCRLLFLCAEACHSCSWNCSCRGVTGDNTSNPPYSNGSLI